MKHNYTTAIILCAGSGKRMNSSLPKQFIKIDDIPIIIRTLNTFDSCEFINDIILVINKNDNDWYKNNLNLRNYDKNITIVNGGDTRFDSLKEALKVLNKNTKFVCIHDGVRCLIEKQDIMNICNLAYTHNACIATQKSTDTLKSISNNVIVSTINRDTTLRAQTPQVFKKDLLLNAIINNKLDSQLITDDSMLLENIGVKVYYYICESNNIKITTQQDVILAQQLLNKKETQNNMHLKIGNGYDLHKLVDNRDLILGGVKISHCKGLLGHSDADVLIHAIIDSLLGAAGLPNIGQLFPDNAPEYKNISSVVLLKKVKELLIENNYNIVNIDCVIVAEAPKINPYIETMKNTISNILNINNNQINIKPKTSEKLGIIGEELAIEAYSVCLLSY